MPRSAATPDDLRACRRPWVGFRRFLRCARGTTDRLGQRGDRRPAAVGGVHDGGGRCHRGVPRAPARGYLARRAERRLRRVRVHDALQGTRAGTRRRGLADRRRLRRGRRRARDDRARRTPQHARPRGGGDRGGGRGARVHRPQEAPTWHQESRARTAVGHRGSDLFRRRGVPPRLDLGSGGMDRGALGLSGRAGGLLPPTLRRLPHAALASAPGFRSVDRAPRRRRRHPGGRRRSPSARSAASTRSCSPRAPCSR